MFGSQCNYVDNIKVNKVFVTGERFQKMIPFCVKRVRLILRFDNGIRILLLLECHSVIG